MQIQKPKPGYKLESWHFGSTFHIPNNWEVLPFGDGIKFLTDYEANGSYAKLDEFAKVGIGKPHAWFVRSVDLEKQRYGLVEGNQYVNKSSYDFLKKTMLYGEEMLLMKVGSIGNVYLMPKVNIPATLGNNLYLIFTNEKLLSKFAFYWFKSALGYSSLLRIASTTTLPSINKDNTRSSLVFFPPKNQQQKIASILSNVDSLITQYDYFIESAKKIKVSLTEKLLTKGIKHSKFKKTKIGQIPEKWEIKKLSEVCSLQPGYAFKSKNFSDHGIKLLKGINVQVNCIDWNDLDYYPKNKSKKFLDYLLNEGDIVIAMDRPFISNGFKIARISQNDIPCLLVQRIGRFSKSNMIDYELLFQILQSKFYRNNLRIIQKGMDLPHISKEEILSPLIGLPPKNEQEKITSILSSMDDRLSKLEAKKNFFKILKKGLMQKLLTGQILV